MIKTKTEFDMYFATIMFNRLISTQDNLVSRCMQIFASQMQKLKPKISKRSKRLWISRWQYFSLKISNNDFSNFLYLIHRSIQLKR